MNENKSTTSITKAETLCKAVEVLKRAVERLERFVDEINGEGKPSLAKEEPKPSPSLSYVLATIPSELNKLVDRIYAAEESLQKDLI